MRCKVLLLLSLAACGPFKQGAKSEVSIESSLVGPHGEAPVPTQGGGSQSPPGSLDGGGSTNPPPSTGAPSPQPPSPSQPPSGGGQSGSGGQPTDGQSGNTNPSPSPTQTPPPGGNNSCPEGYQWASDVGCVPYTPPPSNMGSLPWVDAADLAQPGKVYPLFEDTVYASTSTGDCAAGDERVHTLRLVNAVVRVCAGGSQGAMTNCGPYKRHRVQRYGPVNDFVCKRGSQFTVKSITGSQSYQVSLGYGDDQPVLADFDSDGFTDLAVYRVSEGAFYFHKEHNSFRNSDMSQVGGRPAQRVGSSPVWKVRFGEPLDFAVLSHDGHNPASGNLGRILLGVSGYRPGHVWASYYRPVYLAQKCSTVPVYEYNPAAPGFNAAPKVGVNEWTSTATPTTPSDDTTYCRKDFVAL